MTLEEATKKAEQPIQPKNGTANAYTIPFELAEAAKNLVGKTLKSKDPRNTHTTQVLRWVGQNYVICVDEANYDATPVVYLLQYVNKGILVVA